MPEIEKALAELKRLMDYRIQCAETDEQREKERGFYGLGLTSRKNLCIHPEVSSRGVAVMVKLASLPRMRTERCHLTMLLRLRAILTRSFIYLLGFERKEGQSCRREMSRPDQ